MPTVLLLAALVLAAGEAGAPEAGDVRAEVRALLGVIDRPVSPESFRRFGPAGEAALADIARSGDLPPRRARALEVLASLESPRAEEVHRAIAGAPREPRTVRRAAVLGLGRILPEERAGDVLRPIFERDADPHVRAAAAEALAAAAPRSSCASIRRQARREEPAGAARFRRAVAACDRAPAAPAPR